MVPVEPGEPTFRRGPLVLEVSWPLAHPALHSEELAALGAEIGVRSGPGEGVETSVPARIVSLAGNRSRLEALLPAPTSPALVLLRIEGSVRAGGVLAAKPVEGVTLRIEAPDLADRSTRLLPVRRARSLDVSIEASGPAIMEVLRARVRVAGGRRPRRPIRCLLVRDPLRGTFVTSEPLSVALPKRAGEFRLEVAVAGHAMRSEPFTLISVKKPFSAARLERAELVALGEGGAVRIEDRLRTEHLGARIVLAWRLDLERCPRDASARLEFELHDHRGARLAGASKRITADRPILEDCGPPVTVATILPRIGSSFEVRLALEGRLIFKKRFTVERPLSFADDGTIVGSLPTAVDAAEAEKCLSFFAR